LLPWRVLMEDDVYAKVTATSGHLYHLFRLCDQLSLQRSP
jgi:hypothetical protein